jgi:heme O synthase-like polyprenyltransferase
MDPKETEERKQKIYSKCVVSWGKIRCVSEQVLQIVVFMYFFFSLFPFHLLLVASFSGFKAEQENKIIRSSFIYSFSYFYIWVLAFILLRTKFPNDS